VRHEGKVPEGATAKGVLTKMKKALQKKTEFEESQGPRLSCTGLKVAVQRENARVDEKKTRIRRGWDVGGGLTGNVCRKKKT